MPKWIKITLISLGSLIGLVLVVLVIACYLVFTPARLTSIVNKLSDKYILCESHFETVDLTLFHTFPDAGLKVRNAVLVNPVEGAASDTLASIESLTVAVNVRDFLKNKDIKVTRLLMDTPRASLYIAPDGSTNFDIFPTSTDTTESEPSESSKNFDIKKVVVNNLSCDMNDLRDGMEAHVAGLCLKVDGTWQDNVADANLRMTSQQLALTLRDSADKETLVANTEVLSLKLKGEGTSDNLAGTLNLAVPRAKVAVNGDQMVCDALNADRKDLLEVDLPFTANLDHMDFTLRDATVALTQYVITLSGSASLPNDEHALTTDITFATNEWQVSELMPVLPLGLDHVLPKGMNADAKIEVRGHAVGTVTDSTMPLVNANIRLSDGTFNYHKALPYDFKKVNADIDAALDLAEGGTSSAVINKFSAVTGKNSVSVTGRVDDLLGKMLVDAHVKGDIRLPDVKPMLPESLNIDAKGSTKLDIHAKANLEQIQAVDLKNMKVDGKLDFSDLDVTLNDDIHATAPALAMAVQIPAKKHTNTFAEICSARITGGKLKAHIASANIDAELSDNDLEAGLSDFMDASLPFMLAATFDMGKINATIDQMSASLTEPKGSFEMVPDKKDPAKVRYKVDYSNSALYARISDSLQLDFAGLSIKGGANYDSTRSNVLQQWSPNLDVDLKRAYVNYSSLNYMLQVPDIKFNYKPERCEIASANVVFGNSDYYLSGAVTGLEKWISHEDMLKGDLHFTSNYTNVDDLLEALSGLGSDPDTLAHQREEDNVAKEANPFIVPRDVDFTLHTRIKDATAFGNDIQELAGDIKVRDGVAVLDQVGFVCKAATMQLTALYKTPRVNHIFLGLDFHLLDIGIHELIDMIPMVDTLVPMLAAIDGNADFHLCAETYVDAFYKPKMSTLRGAAALTGDSLVVLDSETFDKIAKLMLFSKKTQNVIDSLDVELTVFRKEVELYPFLISMDKYQVVAAGRHNLDMNYDYHLEIIHSPLPTRLAVDALGVMPKVGIKLSKCRYSDLYKPEKHNDLEARTMALKKMIVQSLEANVKEETRKYQGLDSAE